MSFATRLLLANPGAQVSSALAGSLTTPGAKGAARPEIVGAFDALSTVVVPSGGLSSVTFSGFPQTGYTNLQIRYMVKSTRTSSVPLDELNLRMNGDSNGNYAQHCLFGNGSAANANSLTGQNNIELGSGFIGDNETGSQFGVGVVDILDYASSSKTKVVRMLGGVDMNGVVLSYGGRVGLGSGLWNNTSPITSLTFYAENGNLVQYSSFALYGVK